MTEIIPNEAIRFNRFEAKFVPGSAWYLLLNLYLPFHKNQVK